MITSIICIFLLISDLKRNLLVIGSTGTETPFLAESELPECARLSNRQMEGKSASELEDQQLAEALAKSQAEMGKKEEELKNKDILSSDKFSEGLFLFLSFKS